MTAAATVGPGQTELISQNYASAVLNILEDFTSDRNQAALTQKAIINILEDANDEKMRLSHTQKAVMNILDDFDAEKKKVDVVNTELLQEIGQRTRAEAALTKRTDELARSNEELESFAYVASHDLQEPLRMVASYTTLLGETYRGKLDPEADEYIAFAVDGAKRMQQLIQDLLAYSRVRTQARPFERVALAAVVEESLKDLRAAIEESSATLTVKELPCVMGDRVQLRQLFQNLIGNALKYRGNDPPRVTLSSRRENDAWIVSVADNGIGIDARHADRIFLPFQRLHTRREYPGTGIGLAIVRKIVERHDGRIWVESDGRTGSTFFFTIPARNQKGELR